MSGQQRSSGGPEPPPGIVVVGASAGGVEALMKFVEALPPDLAVGVCVVLHISATSPSVLPSILDRAGPLPAMPAKDGAPVLAGHVYVAPPDRHLVVRDGGLRLEHGPRENAHRPAIDPLFRSAAVAYGPGTIGVLLSGALDDGVAGLAAIKAAGGLVLVQDPHEAIVPAMPHAAIARVDVDLVAKAADLAAAVERAVGHIRPAPNQALADGDPPDPVDQPSPYSCPACGGVLWTVTADDAALPSFRCRTGHRYSLDALLAGQDEQVEAALWAALRALEEQAELAARMAERLSNRLPAVSRQYRERSDHKRALADRLRPALEATMSGEDAADPAT